MKSFETEAISHVNSQNTLERNMDKSTDKLYEKMEKYDQYKVLFTWNLCSSYWKQLKVANNSCTLIIMLRWSLSFKSCEQWKDIEFTKVLCTFMASSTTVVDIHIVKILLPIAECKMLATEIYHRVTISEFVSRLQTVQSLEEMNLCIMYNKVDVRFFTCSTCFSFQIYCTKLAVSAKYDKRWWYQTQDDHLMLL